MNETSHKVQDELHAVISKTFTDLYGERAQWCLVALSAPAPTSADEPLEGMIMGGSSLKGQVRLTQRLVEHTKQILTTDMLSELKEGKKDSIELLEYLLGEHLDHFLSDTSDSRTVVTRFKHDKRN